MPVVIPVISRRGYLRGAKEATWGTPVAATFDLPTHTRQIAGTITKISPDIALNTRSRDWIVINGRRWAAGGIGGPAFGISAGIPLMGVLGTDIVTAQPVAPTGGAAVGAITGGTLTAATYWYRVSAVSGAGETLAAAEFSGVVASGSTGSVKVTWAEVPGAIGYNVYGRTTGAELKLLPAGSPFVGAGVGVQVSVPGGVTTFTDTGSATPSGALPGAGTFGPRHLFTPANALPSYTFEQNRGGFGSSEQFSGCIFGSLQLAAKFDQNDGVLDWVGQLLGAWQIPAPISATAFVKPTDKPAAAAKASLGYGGLSWAKVMDFNVNINNTPEAIKVAAATTDINNAIATALEVHGSARIVFDGFTAAQSSQAIGEYTDWQQSASPTLSFTLPFEDNSSLEVQAKSTILENFKFNDSGNYVEASFDFKIQDPVTNFAVALANTQAASY